MKLPRTMTREGITEEDVCWYVEAPEWDKCAWIYREESKYTPGLVMYWFWEEGDGGASGTQIWRSDNPEKYGECYLPSLIDTATEMWAEELKKTQAFWEERMPRKDSEKVVIVNHTWYTRGQERGAGEKSFRGFGGHKWHIKYHDGREMVSTNLWHGGKIPPAMYDKLPDNAVFVPVEAKYQYGKKIPGLED